MPHSPLVARPCAWRPAHEGRAECRSGFNCLEMQQVDGRPLAELIEKGTTCEVVLTLPTFTETAEMAGISRVMRGYHIQADHIDGLELGRKVAQYKWPKFQAYFDGTAAPN